MRRGKAVDIKAIEAPGEVTVAKFGSNVKLKASAGDWTRFSRSQSECFDPVNYTGIKAV